MREIITAKKIAIVSVKLIKEKGFLYKDRRCETPEAGYNLFANLVEDRADECLAVACLNIKNEPVNISVIQIGTIGKSLAIPRSIVRNALLSNASSVIVCHNHPSGDPMPSKKDVEFTQSLDKACKLMQINLLDHLIIGFGGQFISLRREKLGIG